MRSVFTSRRTHVGVIAPAHGDLVVITTCGGRMTAIQPVREYDAALRHALAMADRAHEPVKVLSMTLTEAVLFCGLRVDEFLADLSDDDIRRRGIETGTRALFDSDLAVQADAYELLNELGALPQC